MWKQYILYIVVILLSIINIINTNNTSALSYSSSVGVGFTFNPTLSVNISSDLIINNLVPGSSSSDSNIINVSVVTNASYGYTLSAIVNGNNNDLVHTNGTNIFSSIATDADLADLEDSEDTNIWGYSYKDNTVDTPTWSNYNGLSNSNSTTLLDTNINNTETGIDSVDFKIAAKASNAQPSGTYTSTINFTAVTKHIPVTLAEAYASEGKTMINGFYTMQDMTSTICSKVEAIGAQLQVLDIRDGKLYKIAKLKDNKCWMAENLDLAGGTKLSSETTDFDTSYTIPDTQGWQADGTLPESSTSGFDQDNYAFVYNSSSENCSNNSSCYSYYSWDAATLGSGRITTKMADTEYSICPKNWRLPKSRNIYGANWQTVSDFYALAHQYGLDSTTSTSENDGEFYSQAGPGTTPNFVFSGTYAYNILNNGGSSGTYWSATTGGGDSYAWSLNFNSSRIETSAVVSRRNGAAVRCLAR